MSREGRGRGSCGNPRRLRQDAKQISLEKDAHFIVNLVCGAREKIGCVVE